MADCYFHPCTMVLYVIITNEEIYSLFVLKAQLLYSKHFQHRTEGLDNIITELSLQTSGTTVLLGALTLTLQKLLKDKVFQV